MEKPRTLKILAGTGVALLAAVLLFDWNWFRAPFESYLARKSGREVRIGHLDVQPGPNPTIRLRDLYVQNAPWAAVDKPLIVAAEAAFTFSLRSLWHEQTLVSKVLLVDADVDLQSRADGLRNWRLNEPEYRGPPKSRVLAIEALRSKVRILNERMDLDIALASQPLEGAQAAGGGGRLTTRLAFTGKFRGASFEGVASTGDVVTLRLTGTSFPLAGHIEWAGTRVALEGTAADILDLTALDADLRMRGASLAGVHPFFKVHPPATRPYELSGRIALAGGEYALTAARGKVGSTDVAGEGSYRPDSPDHARALLRVAMHSNSADLADFGAMPGTGPRAKGAGRLLPAGKFEIERLKATDASFKLEVKNLRPRGALALESLRIEGELKDGVLLAKTVAFGMAGGKVAGTVTADARGPVLAARATAEIHGVRLEKLFPDSAARSRSAGAIEGRLALAGQGDSVAALLGHASGTFAASLDHGRISNLADAKIALNGAKVLALKFKGDQDIGIHCAEVAIDVRDGAGRFRRLVLDTEQTHTDGAGSVDLRGEKFDVVFKSRPKKAALFALDSPIRVRGTFRDAHVWLDRTATAPPPGADGACGAVLDSSR